MTLIRAGRVFLSRGDAINSRKSRLFIWRKREESEIEMRLPRGSRSTRTGTFHGRWPREELGKSRSAAWQPGFLQLLIPICGEAVGGGGDRSVGFRHGSALARCSITFRERRKKPELSLSASPCLVTLLCLSVQNIPSRPEVLLAQNNMSFEEVSPAAAEEHYG